MGNFYTNISFKTSDQEAIIEYLNDQRRIAYVSSVENGFVTVFDELCDRQDMRELTRLGQDLSEILACPGISVLNHDDDVFWYQVYHNGEVIDEYNSSPGYFSGSAAPPTVGNPAALCQAFGLNKVKELTEILARKELFASSIHGDVAYLLGLPTYSIGLGFEYIGRGELDVLGVDEFEFDEDEDQDGEDTGLPSGWVKTPTAMPAPAIFPMTRKSNQVAPKHDDIQYWPGYGERVDPADASDLDAYMNCATAKMLQLDFEGAIEDFNKVLEPGTSY
ncbi:MAG: hypothetical protein K2Z81_12085, partial [Cyanobacteria bacterium]|nr:hypothetical protein [Cyanobacteriota bacterium]